MFRGLGVTTFRVNGLPEARVALWSSVVFGLISSSVVAAKSYVGATLFILADLVLLIIVLVRRHQFEPEPARA